jgi:hypothetical protein
VLLIPTTTFSSEINYDDKTVYLMISVHLYTKIRNVINSSQAASHIHSEGQDRFFRTDGAGSPKKIISLSVTKKASSFKHTL